MKQWMLVGAILGLVGVADARRPISNPNQVTLSVDMLVDADEGFLPDAGAADAFKAQVNDDKLDTDLNKCGPKEGRRFALAFLEVGKKKSKVTIANPDRKWAACVGAALSRLHGDDLSVVITVKVGPAAPVEPNAKPF